MTSGDISSMAGSQVRESTPLEQGIADLGELLNRSTYLSQRLEDLRSRLAGVPPGPSSGAAPKAASEPQGKLPIAGSLIAQIRDVVEIANDTTQALEKLL